MVIEFQHRVCERRFRRGGSMEPKPRHLFSPAHGCDNPACRETAAECDRLRDLVRKSAVESSKLAEEISGAYERDRAQGKEIAYLKRERTRQANADVEAGVIRRVLEFWKETHRDDAQVPEGGVRWDTVKGALRLMKDDPAGPVEALLEALQGARLAPFEQYGKWHATPGKGRTRRDDITDVLRNEVKISMFRGIAQRVAMAEPERLWLAYEITSSVSEEYHRLAIEKLTGYEDGVA